MNYISKTEHARKVLLSAHWHFTAEADHLRSEALDQVIQNVLYSLPPTQSDTAMGICQSIAGFGGGAMPDQAVVDRRLRQLLRQEFVVIKAAGPAQRYAISEQVRQRIANQQALADSRLVVIAQRLFGDRVDIDVIAEVLLLSLSELTATLARENLAPLSIVSRSGRAGAGDEQRQKSISEISKKHTDKNSAIAPNTLYDAIVRVITDPDPQYQELLANLLQNCFVTQALGLDNSRDVLSRELFSNSVFLLDTNIIIGALGNHDEHSRWFAQFARMANDLEISLVVSAKTIDQLEAWVDGQKQEIERFGTRVPEYLAGKIDSPFIEALIDARSRGEDPSSAELLHAFANPSSDLQERFGVKVLSADWFETHETDPPVIVAAEAIRLASEQPGARRKSRRSAMHDALCLCWVDNERGRSESRCWFLTADRPLSRMEELGDSLQGCVIGVGTLIHWMSPFFDGAKSDDYVANFVDLVRFRYLPPVRLYSVADFAYFDDVNVSFDHLGQEDLEPMLREIRDITRRSDPADAETRAKIAYLIRRGTADPASASSREIRELREEIKAVESSRLDELRTLQEQVNNLIESKQMDMDELKGKVKTEAELRLTAEKENRDLAERIAKLPAEFALASEANQTFLMWKLGIGVGWVLAAFVFAFASYRGGLWQALASVVLFGVPVGLARLFGASTFRKGGIASLESELANRLFG